MADYINFEGIHANYVTMRGAAALAYDVTQRNGSSHVGKAVSLTNVDETVGLVATGGEVFGKLIKVESDGMCTIQDEGYAEMPTDGTTIVSGSGVVGGATAGLVKTAVAVPAAGGVRTASAVKTTTGSNAIVKIR